MSQKAKILMTEVMPLVKEEKKILAKYADVKLAKSPAENDIVADVGDVDIIMVCYSKITSKIIDSANKLKGIVRYGIGVDNIDLAAATKKNIPIANVPNYGITTVADHVFALLLALNRKILMADRMVKSAQLRVWTSPPSKLKGHDINGKVLGIVGFGRIGKAVNERAKGFGMKVLTSDPYITKKQAKDAGARLVDLDVLLKESDFVTIHAPLIPETHGMIDEKKLRLMKKTAYLINASRGALIKQKTLIKALKEGWIAGAGIDVYEKEPPDSQDPLLKLDNVILTPHIAWFTEEATRRLEMLAVDEAIRMLQGQLPKNLVNKEILKK